MTTDVTPRTWAIARHRITEDVVGSVIVWAAFALVVAAIGAAIAVAGTIGTSVWEQASQLPRWYAGAVGVYFTAVYLPMYVAHGQTRREFGVQIPPVIALFSGMLALLMTVGFAIETVIYRAFDWPQTLTVNHLFDAPTQLGLVFFAEFALVFVVWTIAGAVVGAGFYRDRRLGFALLLPGIPAIAWTETVVGPTWAGSLPILAGAATGSLVSAVVTALGIFALGVAAMWLVIRDLPLRTRDA